MKKNLLAILFSLASLVIQAQDYFGGALWIGAITREQAHIPEGRHYQGSVLKETKELWAKADTLSRRSIILRRSFKPWKAIRKAELRICGLGFYELTINDKKVGDAEFAPLWSDYDKSIFYNLYDVTDYLQQDYNEIRVLLGNGFYNEQGGRYHRDARTTAERCELGVGSLAHRVQQHLWGRGLRRPNRTYSMETCSHPESAQGTVAQADSNPRQADGALPCQKDNPQGFYSGV